MFAWLKRWRGHKVRSTSLAHANPVQRYREQWRDCCDCIHDKEISSNRCRKCFDDPARPDWVAKWANPGLTGPKGPRRRHD